MKDLSINKDPQRLQYMRGANTANEKILRGRKKKKKKAEISRKPTIVYVSEREDFVISDVHQATVRNKQLLHFTEPAEEEAT